uniref:F-box protein 16 n=1 Tax=Amphilophus citrinellus TaxID=61819 RepID=A0A3Q0S094_AMPCI
MPRAQSPPASCAKMQTKLSTWTPLNNPRANSKVRSAQTETFDRWSDSQRKAVLQDLVLNCSMEQLRFLSISVSRQLPLQAADFTCLLPRALSLYLFSFLDPRSLCRCAQVSWHWKSIVELDQLWMPKCLRLGWSLNFSPKPFEQGIWKRRYIQMVQELSHKEPTETQKRPASTKQEPGSSFSTRLKKDLQPGAPPPWRDSDRHPKDTLRFNYLDNLDPIEQALRIVPTPHRSAPPAPSAGLHPPPHQTETHPPWTSHRQDYPVTAEAAKSLLRLAHWNAGICPRPVRTPVPRLSVEALRAFRRSHRSIPSK